MFHCSTPALDARQTGQGWAGLHCDEGANAQEHGGEYKWEGQVVEYLSNGRLGGWRDIPGVVVEEVLWGTENPSSTILIY